jgi:hypothetical protein
LSEFLFQPFIELMNDIGRYGHDKYKENSFQSQAARGEVKRVAPRQLSEEIGQHAAEHFQMYLRGELHDKFNTRGHQLAAVAFNAMMEYYFDCREQA